MYSTDFLWTYDFLSTYGAKNMSQFKDELKCLGTIIAKENPSEKDKLKRNENSEKERVSKNPIVIKDAKKKVKCYNYGERGHVLNDCQNKEKGRKCYKSICPYF